MIETQTLTTLPAASLVIDRVGDLLKRGMPTRRHVDLAKRVGARLQVVEHDTLAGAAVAIGLLGADRLSTARPRA